MRHKDFLICPSRADPVSAQRGGPLKAIVHSEHKLAP